MTLADRVDTHLREAPASWHDITIRHLLTHTSGLRREAPAADLNQDQVVMDFIRSALPVPLRWAPGDVQGRHMAAGHAERRLDLSRPGFTRLPKQRLTIIVMSIAAL